MLSKLDKKILRALNRNGRKSFRQVAKEAETSSTAIYNNVKKLEETGVIKGYIPIVDPKAIGYNITAMICLRTQHDRETKLAEILSQYEEVRVIHSVTGEWDQVLFCYFKELHDLNAFLFNKLNFPEIRRVVSHIVLHTAKEDRRTPIPCSEE